MSSAENHWAEIAIQQNRRWLRAYILSATGDGSSCDDLVQEVFAIAYQKRDSFEIGTNFGGWLRVIARNVIRRHHERTAREPLCAHDDAMALLEQVAEEAEELACDPFYAERRRRHLKLCLARLTPRVRRLLQLRYLENQSSQLVAKMLQMSVSAVDVAAFRARMALARCVTASEKKASPT